MTMHLTALPNTTALILALIAGLAHAQPAREWLVGGDISALAVLQQHGAVFRDGGKQGDAIAIMRAHGCSCFRLRIFVNPTGKGVVVNDSAHTIGLARRIKAANAKLLLDFHYSDTWADPAHQLKPKAWEGLDFETLVKTVRTYTRNTLREFEKAGVLPDYVQLGNEINPGMLWPDAKLWGSGDPEAQFGKLARLLKAGAAGVDAVGADRSPRIVIHVASGGNWGQVRRFFDRIQSHAVPYDVR